MSRQLWLVFCLFFCFQGFAKPPKTQKQQAKELHQQGKDAYERAQNFHEALRLFQEAYALEPTPDILINIGQCYRQLAQYKEALQAFEQALAQTKDPEVRVKIQEVLDDLRPRVQAPASEPASEPATAPTSAPASAPVEEASALEALALPMLESPASDEPRSRLGVAFYAGAGAAAAFGGFAGVRALSLGLSLSEDIAGSPDLALQQRQQTWAVASTLSLGTALVASSLGYWRLPTEKAPKVLWGGSSVAMAFGLGSALLGFREASQLKTLRAQPDADPLALRQGEAARVAYGRGATVLISGSLALGTVAYWLRVRPLTR